MTQPPPTLPALYYLDNFRRVVHSVHHQYYDVLTPDERQWIAQFRALNPRAQALLVRMVMRRGIHFRSSQLDYPELGDTTPILNTLVRQGWLEANPTLNATEFCQQCSLVELQQWARQTQLSRPPTRKADWPEWLTAHHPAARPWQAWWHDQPASALFRLQQAEFYDRLKLLFFGSSRPGWETFVIADLGYQQFPVVAIREANRAFQSRLEIDVCQQLEVLRQGLAQGEDPASLIEQLPQADPVISDWLWQRRERLYDTLIQQLERLQHFELASQHYARCSAPGARLRWLRLLAKRKDYATLAEPLMAAYHAPEDEAEAQGLEKLRRRVQPHLPESLPQRPRQTQIPPLRQNLTLPQSALRVERAVSEYLQTSEQPVWWSENTLWNALFGLLFWPALFAPIAGAFFHPYQAGPADLYRPDFIRKRQPWFDQQWQVLEQPNYTEVLLSRYAEYEGLTNAFVPWSALSRERINWALHCIPKGHLRLIFERMMQDFKHHRSGFPDLIQFDLINRNYQMIEVKGPGDRLQDHQLRWLWFFQQHQIPARVMDVQWLNDSSI